MECKLYPVDGSHNSIALEDGKVVRIGRGSETKVTDRRCSREQVELRADFESMEVQIKQLGSHSSSIGTSLLCPGDVHVLGPGGMFCLIHNKYKYCVQFIDHTANKSDSSLKCGTTPSEEHLSAEQNFTRNSGVRRSKLASLFKRSTPSDDENSGKHKERSSDEHRRKKFKLSFKGRKSKDKSDGPIWNKLQAENSDSASCMETHDGHVNVDTDCLSSNSSYTSLEDLHLNSTSKDLLLSPMDIIDGLSKDLNSERTDLSEFMNLQEDFGIDFIKEIRKEFSFAEDELRNLHQEASSTLATYTRHADCKGVATGASVRDHVLPSISSIAITLNGENAKADVSHGEWYVEDGFMMFSEADLTHREKVAVFDMDGTLIETKSGRLLPSGVDDWKLKYDLVPTKLLERHNAGYKIVILSNQKSLGKSNASVEDFKRRTENVLRALSVPCQCLVSTRADIYRRPAPGMWWALSRKFNGGMAISVVESVYVGDAAGRMADSMAGNKNDSSCSDRCFAANIGLPFYTPEEFFLGLRPDEFHWPSFDPRKISRSLPLLSTSESALGKKDCEVAVMVGYPASGKTTFAKNYLVSCGYERVSTDELGSWQKCLSTCTAALVKGRSVVVDNTNPDASSRQRYIELARDHRVAVRCYHVVTSYEQSVHNNKFRELTTSEASYQPVGVMAFNRFRTMCQDPNLEEGFDEIIRINFVPAFDDKDREQLYFSFL